MSTPPNWDIVVWNASTTFFLYICIKMFTKHTFELHVISDVTRNKNHSVFYIFRELVQQILPGFCVYVAYGHLKKKHV